MQQIYAARNAMEAHFLRGLLKQEGIEAVVQGEMLEEVWADVPVGSRSVPSVWVNEVDLERATPIVADYDKRRLEHHANATDSGRATWKCPRCGEMIEEQFTQCWHCNTQRPSMPG